MPPVIEVDHVTKEFRLGQLTSLATGMKNGMNRLLGRPVAERAAFKALDDLNFTVEQGEVLGLIGHNGAGKSTLLKILAGISRPTHGRVAVHGRVAPMIEVGAGLVPDMTGRENIFLNASILGMKRAEIKRKFDEIVAFAEMEEFIDTPVKRYSSGMQVRLGFSIATAVDSEVLIVDEVLAVGDLAFQRKCYDRIEGFVRDGARTLLLVSHNLRQIERLCTRALLMNHGRLELDDSPKAACQVFVDESNARIVSNRQVAKARHESSGELGLEAVAVMGRRQPTVVGVVVAGDDIIVEATFDVLSDLENVRFTVGVHTTDLFFIAVSSSETSLSIPVWTRGRQTVRCVLSSLVLTPGAYAIHVAVDGGAVPGPVFRGDNASTFQVVADDARQTPESERYGSVVAHSSWSLGHMADNEAGAPVSHRHEAAFVRC